MVNNKIMYNKIFACPVWYNGMELNHGTVREYYDEKELEETIASAWSGCHWFVGNSLSEVQDEVNKYISSRTS